MALPAAVGATALADVSPVAELNVTLLAAVFLNGYSA